MTKTFSLKKHHADVLYFAYIQIPSRFPLSIPLFRYTARLRKIAFETIDSLTVEVTASFVNLYAVPVLYNAHDLVEHKS